MQISLWTTAKSSGWSLKTTVANRIMTQKGNLLIHPEVFARAGGFLKV